MNGGNFHEEFNNLTARKHTEEADGASPEFCHKNQRGDSGAKESISRLCSLAKRVQPAGVLAVYLSVAGSRKMMRLKTRWG